MDQYGIIIRYAVSAGAARVKERGDIELESNIAIWCVQLEASPEELEAARALLSTSELETSGRFRFPHLRHNYVLSHAVLRILLGRYLQAHPAALEFTKGPHGKPSLAGEDAHLRFNLAHSGGMAVYAFTLQGEIGVDVEHFRPIDTMPDIAERYFSPEEAADLASLSAEEMHQAFFRCWTRKEAYVKAIGSGLYAPLDGFRVSLLAAETPALLGIEGGEPGDWSVHSFEPAPGYLGAAVWSKCSLPVRMHPAVSAARLLEVSGSAFVP